MRALSHTTHTCTHTHTHAQSHTCSDNTLVQTFRRLKARGRAPMVSGVLKESRLQEFSNVSRRFNYQFNFYAQTYYWLQWVDLVKGMYSQSHTLKLSNH